MKENEPYFQANQALWDAKTAIHLTSEMYDLEAFKAGKDVLREVELGLIGDIKGKSILHLQCHFGQDTLNLARMGACCTGVDFSSQAIVAARQLNEELGLDARFIECNVYDLPQHLDESFDIIYTSYGVIGWLPDLQPWAAIIHRYLKAGGFFLMVEFHPMLYTLDWNPPHHIIYHYFDTNQVDEATTQGTYADFEADIQMKEYFWAHSFGDIFSPLLQQGLQLTHFQEYPFSPYPCFREVEQIGPYRWKFKNMPKEIPYIFSLKMTQPKATKGRQTVPHKS